MRALLSVANREGITAFARDLGSLGVEMFATDGTREFLAGEGIDVSSVTDLTDGERKTCTHHECQSAGDTDPQTNCCFICAFEAFERFR